MIKARSYRKLPFKVLSSGTSCQTQQAIEGGLANLFGHQGKIRAQRAIEHTKPHSGYVICIKKKILSIAIASVAHAMHNSADSTAVLTVNFASRFIAKVATMIT